MSVAELVKSLLKLLLGRGSVRSFSQFGEDTLASSFFRGRKSGVYVDVGAYHPMLYSNTYFFYRRGWSGIVIDPNPALAGLFSVLRPRDRFVTAGVGKGKSLQYYEFADGAYNTCDPTQVAEQKKRKGIEPIRTYQVAVRTLADILEEHQVKAIDILSVDVEGMDLDVLETHNWNIRPRVIIAEDRDFLMTHPEASPVYTYLIEKGYTLKAVARLSLIFEATQV